MRTSISKWVAILLVALGASGCSIFHKKHKDYVRTPAGHKVYEIEDQGSFVGGHLTQEQVLANLDFRIEEWVKMRAAKSGRPEEKLRIHALENCTYRLRDHWMFKTTSSSTGYAAGMAVGCGVWVAIWSHGISKTSPPQGTPPHTILFNEATGNYNWGYLREVDGVPRGLDALGHELDHTIGYYHGDM